MKGPTVKLQSDGLPGLPHTVVQAEDCNSGDATDYGAGANYEANGW